MTTWDDYVAAMGELDTARRNAAAAVASQERAAEAAKTELNGVRQRMALQRARLVDVASRAGRAVPIVEPQSADRSAAALLVPASVMDPTPGVSAALKGALEALDEADGTIAIAAEAPSGAGLLPDWSPAARNALPYAWYALLAVVALVFINGFASSPSARVVAVGFDLGVPVGAFLLGTASIGLLYAPDRAGRKPRSIRLGLLICLVPLLIGVALSVL